MKGQKYIITAVGKGDAYYDVRDKVDIVGTVIECIDRKPHKAANGRTFYSGTFKIISIKDPRFKEQFEKTHFEKMVFVDIAMDAIIFSGDDQPRKKTVKELEQEYLEELRLEKRGIKSNPEKTKPESTIKETYVYKEQEPVFSAEQEEYNLAEYKRMVEKRSNVNVMKKKIML